jgi:hypothetical protein
LNEAPNIGVRVLSKIKSEMQGRSDLLLLSRFFGGFGDGLDDERTCFCKAFGECRAC